MRERGWLVVWACVALAGCGAGRPPAPSGKAPTAGKAGAGVAIGAADEHEGTSDPAELARAAVERVVGFYADALRECYALALRQRSEEGTLTFAWDVTADGEAARVRLVDSTLRPQLVADTAPPSALADCVATQIGRWRFSPHARGRGVSYTFTFQPWSAPASQPGRRSASETVADLPEFEWEYRIGGRLPHREPHIGPPRSAGEAPGSMPAPSAAASRPVRGTVPWAGPVIRGRSCVEQNAVRERLVQSVALFQQCYERERKRHPRLEGRLVLKITIAGDGTTTAGVERSTLGPEGVGLAGCVAMVARGWRFTPRRGCEGVTSVAFPLSFSPP
jgi:hypothetical protein